MFTTTTSAFASTGSSRSRSIPLFQRLFRTGIPLAYASASRWIKRRLATRLNSLWFPTEPGTGLEQILKNMHVVYPIFIGSFTDGCLGLTAADSISRGFLPTVRTQFRTHLRCNCTNGTDHDTWNARFCSCDACRWLVMRALEPAKFRTCPCCVCSISIGVG